MTKQTRGFVATFQSEGGKEHSLFVPSFFPNGGLLDGQVAFWGSVNKFKNADLDFRIAVSFNGNKAVETSGKRFEMTKKQVPVLDIEVEPPASLGLLHNEFLTVEQEYGVLPDLLKRFRYGPFYWLLHIGPVLLSTAIVLVSLMIAAVEKTWLPLPIAGVLWVILAITWAVPVRKVRGCAVMKALQRQQRARAQDCAPLGNQPVGAEANSTPSAADSRP